jgi:hypothetical protein
MAPWGRLGGALLRAAGNIATRLILGLLIGHGKALVRDRWNWVRRCSVAQSEWG